MQGPNGALPGAPAGGVKRRFEDAEVGPAGPAGPDFKRQAGGGAMGGYGAPSGPETVLRLLVSAKRVGSVIGKGGSIVRQVSCTAAPDRCGERPPGRSMRSQVA